MTDSDILARASPAAARQIDQACDQFEAAWKSGRRPDPAEYLAPADEPVRSNLLRELLVLDWDYRRRQGDSPQVGDYHSRFPRDGAVIEAVGRDMAESPVSTQDGDGDGTGCGVAMAVPTLLEHPATQPHADVPRYNLEREIGQGGIGIVFRGRDTVLGRDIAVKVLGEAYRDRPDARRRFIAEARIGSQLQHPAIIPVYELGRFADGRPYITMKLVEGHTLATLLKQRMAPDDDLARFLNVFEQVCQAMAYAHNKGVVHRDLKPANVMVGAFGEVQVMDWGFAKVLADDPVEEPASLRGGTNGMSQGGGIMGTPAYMSPEQARGEAALIDPRADVFALGAILCEILTGRPPYGGGTADAVCLQAIDGDLTEAHGRLAECGADAALRNLTKRCLTVDRAARPADAGVVAQAVTAHLASAQSRAMRAEIESAAANMRTKAERRARQLTGGLAAALLIGAAVAAWQAVVATRAKHDALSAAAAETVAKQTADTREAETRAVLDFVEKKVIAAARPKGRFGGLGPGVTVRQALKAALPFVEKSFTDRPLIEARLRVAVGGWLFEVGDFAAAADQLRAAGALYTKHRGAGDRDTLSAMSEYANCLGAMGRGAEAAKIHEQVLATCRATFGPDDAQTLFGMNNLAMSYFVLERYGDAIRLHEEALPIKRAKFGPDDRSTLTTMVNLANCYGRLDRQLDALKLREETIALQRARLGPKDYDTLMSLNNLASNYRKLDRHADALSADQEALAARTETLGPNHPDTLTSMWGEAEDLCNLGRGAEAVPILDDCLRRAVGQRVHSSFPTVADLRLRHFQKMKDPAGCRATAELWEMQRRTDAPSLYEAAVCRAVTAAVIGQTPGADATRLTNEQADRALAWVKPAIAAGYKGADKLTQDKDFDALRDRPDFRALTASK